MAKVVYRSLTEHSSSTIRKELIHALQECGGTRKGIEFLLGLLTESEIIMLGRRIQIARRLLLHESQAEIQIGLHVGQTTIEGVEKWLQKKLPGYRRNFYVAKKKSRGKDLSADHTLRQRYPTEFLLISLLLEHSKK